MAHLSRSEQKRVHYQKKRKPRKGMKPKKYQEKEILRHARKLSV